jgi:Uma2 family endonuclease
MLAGMSSVAERLTADAYLDRDDPRRTELLDGVIIVNEPTYLHQHVCVALVAALRAWVRGAEGHGAVSLSLDVRVDDDNVLAPDVLWFAERIPKDARRAPRLPDLAVEVRSPSTWAHDIGRKRALYERHGLRELWLVDTTSESVLVFARSDPSAPFDIELELGSGEELRSALLPGFTLRVAELFEI